MNHVEINYLAVLVCGVIAMLVGAMWYGPIFGKAWMKEVGKTEEDLKKDFSPVKTFGLTFVAHLFLALVLAYFIALTGAASVVNGIRVALASWVGFVLAPMFIGAQFAGRSVRLLIIDSGYYLVDMLLFGILLVIW